MRPRLKNDDYVLAARRWPWLRQGQLVVVRHPCYGVLVKRLQDIRGDGRILLRGENDASVSSEQMGWLTRDALIGVVLLRLKAA